MYNYNFINADEKIIRIKGDNYKKNDFTKLPNSKSIYGKKNIEQGIENNKHNDLLIEIAKRLTDK